MDNNKYMITKLKDNQIFVFGSNKAGRHGKGAALTAKQKFGAIYGRGFGFQGLCYAIPTKDENLKILPLSEIKKYLEKFAKDARENPYLEFLLTPIGTGLAGYSIEEIESIMPKLPENVIKMYDVPVLNMEKMRKDEGKEKEEEKEEER